MVTLLVAGVTFDMAQVLWRLVLIFLHYLGSIDLSDWMVSLTTALIFLGGLGLRLISGGRGIVKLSLVFVFIEGLVAELPVGVLFVFLR